MALKRRPRIAVTPGEPAGIGPDLCILAARESLPAELVAIADPDLMSQRASRLGQALRLVPFDADSPVAQTPGGLKIVPVPLHKPAVPGRLDPVNAAYVLETLAIACDGCLEGRFDALVTGPVHKGAINEAGLPFTGHTELLAERCRAFPVMMLAAPGLRVALVTTHLPLKEVSAAVTPERLERVIRILDRELRERFGLRRSSLLVCGLNPHAGEGGHLGREEIEVIEPVLRRLRREGLELMGPAPADTAFVPERMAQADAVLAMYHDQGLPVLKHLGFGRAVNITLGLPFVRTSVDHGTALGLAATGRIDTGSLMAAVRVAAELAARPIRAGGVGR